MKRATVLLSRAWDISERFRIELKVFAVKASAKYPQGIKARYALIDVINKYPRLVVDNHEPFGFHAHIALPKERNNRLLLKGVDYLEAKDIFLNMVEEILKYEN